MSNLNAPDREAIMLAIVRASPETNENRVWAIADEVIAVLSVAPTTQPDHIADASKMVGGPLITGRGIKEIAYSHNMTDERFIQSMRLYSVDHEPDGWPAIPMRDVTRLCDLAERRLAAQVEPGCPAAENAREALLAFLRIAAVNGAEETLRAIGDKP